VHERTKTHPLGNSHLFSGFDRVRVLEAEYLPAAAQEKYADGLGHMPEVGR